MKYIGSPLPAVSVNVALLAVVGVAIKSSRCPVEVQVLSWLSFSQ